MRTRLAFLGLLIVACSGPDDGPAFPEDWTVEGDAPLSLPYLIDAARELAPCELVPRGTASITYVSSPFFCGDTWASGCTYLQDDYIQATSGGASEIVTAHELGHMAWDRCGKTEHLSHPQEFYFWVVKLFDAGRAKYQLALQAQL